MANRRNNGTKQHSNAYTGKTSSVSISKSKSKSKSSPKIQGQGVSDKVQVYNTKLKKLQSTGRLYTKNIYTPPKTKGGVGSIRTAVGRNIGGTNKFLEQGKIGK